MEYDVAILTMRDLSTIGGSTVRPVWQAHGLMKNGFKNFKLCSKEISGNPRLVHAHQDAMYYTKGVPYLADLHGIDWVGSTKAIERWPFSHRKIYAKYFWLPKRRKKEEEGYRRAKALVCAGPQVAETVLHINHTEIVRNAVDLSKYSPTKCTSTKVAVIGPFIEGSENTFTLSMLHRIMKLDKETEYLVIGRVQKQYLQHFAGFRNVTFSGQVEDYLNVLRSCSIFIAPYPNWTLGSTKCKLLDAAASSFAIIASENGGSDFNPNCYLHAETPEQFAKEIQYLKDEDARREMGKLARAEVERSHDHLKETAKLATIYRTYLK